MRLPESAVVLVIALALGTAALYPYRDAITLKSVVTLAMVGAAILAVSLMLMLLWVLLIRLLDWLRGRSRRSN